MGTNGYYIFLCNKIYYIYYQHYDSYLEGLGQDIVNNIKESLKKDCNIKELLSKIPIMDFTDSNAEGIHRFTSIIDSLENHAKYNYYTSTEEPKYDILSFIEFQYIIDIDNNILKIMNMYGDKYMSFPLHNIPDNWIEIFNINNTKVDKLKKN